MFRFTPVWRRPCFSFGTTTATLHAVRQSPEAGAQILSALLRYSLWLVPAGLLAAAVVCQVVLVNLHGATRLWCFLSIATVPLTVFSLSLISFVVARAALSWLALLRTASTGSVALGVVVLAVVGDLTVVSYLALSFGAAILTLGLTASAVRIRPRRGTRLRPLLAFGRRAWAGSIANMANVGLDQALIAPFLGAGDLGHYAIAVTLSLLPLGLSTAIGSRIWGDANITTDADVDLARVGNYVRISMAGAAWMALSLAVTAPLIIPLLYGRAFDASVVPLLLLLPGTVAFSGAWVLEAALVMAGRPGVNSRAELAAVVCTILGLAATLPSIGIVGAAATTSVAYTVRFGVQISVLRRLGTLDWRPHTSDMCQIAREAMTLVRRTAAAPVRRHLRRRRSQK